MYGALALTALRTVGTQGSSVAKRNGRVSQNYPKIAARLGGGIRTWRAHLDNRTYQLPPRVPFGVSNVSRYARGTTAPQIKGSVDEALRTGTVTDRGVVAYLGRTFGTEQAGNPVTGIEVVVRDGIIKTAYPVGVP